MNKNDRLALLLDMTNPDDQKSCRMDMESELDLDTNQVVTGTAYSDEVGEDCDTDEILLNIERSGNQRWDEEVDAEVTITRIPPFTLADGRDAPNTDNSTSASEESDSIPRLTSDEPEPITPGIWFTDAAELAPGEMVTADIVPGETQFFKVPAEYGQKVNGRIRVVEEANDFDRPGGFRQTIYLNAYNEARAGIDLSDSYVRVAENEELPFEYNERILFDHRFGSGGTVRSREYWQDGDQYLTVRYEDPEQGDIDASSQLPPVTYIMTVNTTGQAVPGPEFASFPGDASTSATSAPTEESESPEDTDAQATADSQDSGTSPVVWIIVGLIILAALGAVGYVLTRARRN